MLPCAHATAFCGEVGEVSSTLEAVALHSDPKLCARIADSVTDGFHPFHHASTPGRFVQQLPCRHRVPDPDARRP